MKKANFSKLVLLVFGNGLLVFLSLGLLAGRIVAVDVPRVCTERGTDSMGAAALSDRVWKDRSALRVGFLDGSAFLKNKVRYYAAFWSESGNIKFDFVDKGPFDIRVSFTGDGTSWSYIGTTAKNVEPSEPTMNFGWFNETTAETEFRRTILHEFGHALGLIHEHQSPGAAINWNKDLVYKYYKDAFGWNKKAVDDSIFRKYERTRTQFTGYNPASIMHYAIPAEFTTDRKVVGWNTNLSEKDKEFIKKLYP